MVLSSRENFGRFFTTPITRLGLFFRMSKDTIIHYAPITIITWLTLSTKYGVFWNYDYIQYSILSRAFLFFLPSTIIESDFYCVKFNENTIFIYIVNIKALNLQQMNSFFCYRWLKHTSLIKNYIDSIIFLRLGIEGVKVSRWLFGNLHFQFFETNVYSISFSFWSE